VSIQESKEFEILTEGQISWITSIAILGAVFSCPITGFGMGKYGRRKVMMYLTAPFILGWIVIALARNVWEICVGRFLTGTYTEETNIKTLL
jgi:MFS family permease